MRNSRRRARAWSRGSAGPQATPLGFTGHIDTVPLGTAAWQADAFGASMEGGKLYGRGSSDMKSGVAAFVCAALRHAEMLKRGPGVTLVITADEECGCGGAAYLVKQGKLLGEVGALVIGEPTANYPLVGHKGALWLDVTTRGITAHGSMPERGDNAIYKAAAAIDKLRGFEFGGAPHPLMGRATLNVGTVHGGLNINSVPDATVIGVDIRTIPGQDHALIRRSVAAPARRDGRGHADHRRRRHLFRSRAAVDAARIRRLRSRISARGRRRKPPLTLPMPRC